MRRYCRFSRAELERAIVRDGQTYGSVAAEYDWAADTIRRRARALGLASSRSPGGLRFVEDAVVLSSVLADQSLAQLARRLRVSRYAVALRAEALGLPTRREAIAAYARANRQRSTA
ncbi:hypothetical protein LPLAFNJD_LOCUS1080 [Methylorubrum aminovorans]